MAKAAKVRYRLTVVLAIPGIKPEDYESSRGNSGNYRAATKVLLVIKVGHLWYYFMRVKDLGSGTFWRVH